MSFIVTHDGNALVLDPQSGSVVSAPSIFEDRREISRRAANTNSPALPSQAADDRREGVEPSSRLPLATLSNPQPSPAANCDAGAPVAAASPFYSAWTVQRETWWRA